MAGYQMMKEKNDLSVQGSITFAGALREKNEYNISKIYMKLTWLDFGRLKPREHVEGSRRPCQPQRQCAFIPQY